MPIIAALGAVPTLLTHVLVLVLAPVVLAQVYARIVRSWLDAELIVVGLGLTMSLALLSLGETVLVLVGLDVNRLTSIALFTVLLAGGVWLGRGAGSPRLRIRATLSSAAQRVRLNSTTTLASGGLIATGALAMHFTMVRAAGGDNSGDTFDLFWLSMALLWSGVIVVVAASRAVHPVFVVLVMGAVSYLPAFIRSPAKVFAFDELAHLGEARELVTSSSLFQPDPILPIGPSYPGFESLVGGLSRLAGTPLTATGQYCVLLAHVATIAGVVALANLTLAVTGRGLLITGLAYCAAPQFVQFDSLFSYESVALPLLVWTLVIVVIVTQLGQRSALRARLGIVGGVLAASLGVTHHLTSIMLVVCVALAALGVLVRLPGTTDATPASVAAVNLLDRPDDLSVPTPRRVARSLLNFAVATAVAIYIWSIATQAPLVAYLGAYPRSAWRAVTSYLSGSGLNSLSNASTYSQQQTAVRGLFEGTTLPGYERYTGIGAQFLLLAAVLVCLWTIRRQLAGWTLVWVVLAAAYFISLPLTFVTVASSGAHRSWAVSFVGVAVLLGRLPDVWRPRRGLSAANRPSPGPRRRRFVVRGAALVAGFALLNVGSYATSVNLYDRLPGPYVIADGRDDTPDVINSAKWLARHDHGNPPIVTTRRVGAVFGAYSGARLAPFQGWLVFFPTTQPDDQTVARLVASGAKYLVADRRLATAVTTQSYFQPYEPDPPDSPLPAACLTKFDSSPWLTLIHRDHNISIYKIRGSV